MSERPRDLSFEALAEVCGIDITALTGQTRGILNKALGEIRQATSELEDGELAIVIPAKAKAYRQVMGDAVMTPTALAKHWAQLEGLVAQQTARDERSTNRIIHPSDCRTCGGERVVLRFFRPANQPSIWHMEHRSKRHPELGLPHPAHRKPTDGFEEYEPCPDCNPQALAIARDWRDRFTRRWPPKSPTKLSFGDPVESNKRSSREEE